MRSLKAKIAGAEAILEHFTSDDPVLERNASKRVFAEVTRAWPGEPRRLWWKWFAEASSSLGLRTKTLDCSVDEAVSLAANHAQIVCYREDEDTPEGEWLAVMATTKGRSEVLIHTDHDVTKTVSARALRKALQRFVSNDQVRCVIMQQNEGAVSSEYGGEEAHKLSPFERLWALLKPEASDIWIIVVFAFVVSLLMLATPIAVEALVNTVAFGRFLQPIVVLAVILLTFLGFQAALRDGG